MTMQSSNSKRLAVNGILLALVIVTMFAESLLPSFKITLFTLSSFYIAIIIIEYGAINGWIFYLASCLLLMIVIPNKLMLIPYAMFFGIYGIVKFYIERMKKIVIEYVLKVVYFNIFLIPVIIFGSKLLFSNLIDRFPLWLLIAALEIAFVLYDYVYTVFIRYYNLSLRKKLKI